MMKKLLLAVPVVAILAAPLFLGAQDAKLGALYSITPNRPSQKDGRTHVSANIGATASGAILHTVTPGKTLYVTSMMISGFNDDQTNYGWIKIQDGDTLRRSVLITVRAVGQNPQQVDGVEQVFQEPLRFTTSYKIVLASGTVTYAASVVGYEE